MTADAAAQAASVRRGEDGAVIVGGVVDRTTAARLFAGFQRALDGATVVDLSGVTRVDSAGVALLAALLADLPPAVQVVAPPAGAGLDELRAAYRLDETLAFA